METWLLIGYQRVKCCVYLDLFKIIKFIIIAHQNFENQMSTVK